MPSTLVEIATFIAAASIPALTLGGLLWLWIIVGKAAPRYLSGAKAEKKSPPYSKDSRVRAVGPVPLAPFRDASQSILDSTQLTEEAERHKIA